MQKKNRRSFSGDVFPGRRQSVERTVSQLTSTVRSGLHNNTDHRLFSLTKTTLRRASLQAEGPSAPCRLIVARDELSPLGEDETPESFGGHVAGSSGLSRYKAATLGSPESTSMSTFAQRESINRRASCMAGGLMSSHGNRGVAGCIREPTIFDIGADLMKVRLHLSIKFPLPPFDLIALHFSAHPLLSETVSLSLSASLYLSQFLCLSLSLFLFDSLLLYMYSVGCNNVYVDFPYCHCLLVLLFL